MIISDEQLKQELPYEIREKYKNINCTFSCEDCKWTFRKETEEPCTKCINNLDGYTNKWEPDIPTQYKNEKLQDIFKLLLEEHTPKEMLDVLSDLVCKEEKNDKT